MSFQANRNKGFAITFANGWTASVQFGPGNYCSRRWDAAEPMQDFDWHSDTAEVAASHADGRWHTFEDGKDQRGWIDAAEVLAFLNMVAAKDDTP